MRICRVAVFTAFATASSLSAGAQAPPPQTPSGAPAKPPMVEKLGPNSFRLGRLTINTAMREVSVPGTVNDVTTLEFIANTRGGFKAYESALTLDTDAVTYNAALVLIGLDKSHARVPTRHFDPAAPEGDPVEIWVDLPPGSPTGSRIPAEQLMYDGTRKQPLPRSSWVYTGSTLFRDGSYQAELDGVLIGFVHSPAPIIENVGGPGVNKYGDIVMNPLLRLAPGTAVTLTVKAVGAAGGPR